MMNAAWTNPTMIDKALLSTKETTVHNLANLLLEPETDNLQDPVQELSLIHI